MARILSSYLGYFMAGHAIAAAFLGLYPGATIILPFVVSAALLWWGRPAKQREARANRAIKEVAKKIKEG